MKNEIYTACDQRICHCPEWTVIKDRFIMVDDWNDVFSVSISEVDSYLESVEEEQSAEGVTLCSVRMTKSQLAILKKDWKKWKNKHKELFK